MDLTSKKRRTPVLPDASPDPSSYRLVQISKPVSKELAAVTLSVAILVLIPVIYLFLRSISAAPRAIPHLISFRTATIISNSVVLALLVTLGSLAIALPLAWLTSRTDLPYRRTWLVLSTLPLVFPSYVGSFAIIAMLGPRGLLFQWLSKLGEITLPSIYGLPGAFWTLTIFTYPYLLLSIHNGFRRLDPAVEEAARNLGLTSWKSFWRVTIPALRPAIISGALLVSLYVLSDFGAVSMLRFNTFTMAIYLQYTSSLDRSLAALLTLILVTLTIMLLFAAQHFQGRMVTQSGHRTSRPSANVKLGRWKLVAVLFCIIVVGNALIVPTAIVTYWLVRGIMAGETLLPVWQATINSMQAGILAALTCIVLSLPVAYLTARYQSRFSFFVGQSVYVGYGLPGIAVAISLVFFGANYMVWLYQSLAMLIFAYVVRFMPQSVGTIRTTLIQTSPRIEEASRNLGYGRWGTVRHVLLPLLSPGIMTGGALVFLTTVKELPVTLLLRPTGFNTLATQIWSATEEAFFARAAAPALILLVVSALSIGIVLRQDEETSHPRRWHLLPRR